MNSLRESRNKTERVCMSFRVGNSTVQTRENTKYTLIVRAVSSRRNRAILSDSVKTDPVRHYN